MNHSYNILTHEKVKKQIDDLLENEKSKSGQIAKQIITAYEKLKNDPFGKDNVPFHENKRPKLVGKIRKIYVGGNQRYRLMNLCLREEKLVIPIYLSVVMRRDLDYEKIGWQDIAEEIYNDFLQRKIEKFTKF